MVISFVKLMLPSIMKFNMKAAGPEVINAGLERFHALAGKRTIMCPNHPSPDDPTVMLAFSRLVGEDFNYLAAREVFDFNHGMVGWWFQRLGVYSVVRGAVDRESFKTTKRLLVENEKKLVIFPEGEISRQNDKLMPLETGVAQMGFWALEELQKKQVLEPIFILPLAIKYTYSRDIRPELDRSLAGLSETLAIKDGREQSLYERLRLVAEAVLSSMEREFDYKSPPGATMNERIEGLRSGILQNIAAMLKIELPAGSSQLEWIRILRNSMDDFIYADETELSTYEKKLHEEKARNIRSYYKQLDRVVNFISIYEGYLKDHMTQERFADVLDRLETEVLGERTPKGPRLVRMSVGSPIDLLELYPEYRSGKKATIRAVNEKVAGQINGMLEELDRNRPAVFVE